MNITQMVNNKIRLFIFFAAKDGDTLYLMETLIHSAKTRPVTDCGSDQQNSGSN